VRLCLPCARWKTHGKDSLCRAPDIKRTANIITHGKDAFSRSGYSLVASYSLAASSSVQLFIYRRAHS
jgi:hypothetical protein